MFILNQDARRRGSMLALTTRSMLIQRLGAGFVALALCGPAFAAADGVTTTASAAAAASLSEQESERQAEAISRSIMSPFCPGRTVSSCPNAQPWREDIRAWVREGVPADEIKRRLAERVPKHDLMGVPSNPLGWVLPVGLALAALASLVLLLRYLVLPRARSDSGTEAGEPNAASKVGTSVSARKGSPEDWDARLDQELDTLEQR